jgi:hypothetical protein
MGWVLREEAGEPRRETGMNGKNKVMGGRDVRVFLLGLGLLLPLAMGAGQEAGKAAAAPVSVRVHVSESGRFVDSLTLKDFEVYEDGVLQQIDSLYVVKGQTIGRREGVSPTEPDVSRSYYLLFQTVDWEPKLAEAINYLFSSVLRPGDTMTLVTPWKPYSLQKDALAVKSKEVLAKSMQDLLRKDIQRGGGEYRDIIKTLRRVTNAIDSTQKSVEDDLETDDSASSFSLQLQIDQYRNALMKMQSLRLVDEQKLLDFAGSVKTRPGPKFVYFFYQREFRPEISPMTMQTLLSLYQDDPNVTGNLMDLFQFYKRDATFNAERVKKAFADAGIVFHFIFMDKKSQRVFGGTMREQSEDIFPGFRDISLATGGTCESSKNPAASFEHAATASENFYLLCYTPKETAVGSGFRTIRVKVSAKDAAGKDYTITNKLGYYAR